MASASPAPDQDRPDVLGPGEAARPEARRQLCQCDKSFRRRRRRSSRTGPGRAARPEGRPTVFAQGAAAPDVRDSGLPGRKGGHLGSPAGRNGQKGWGSFGVTGQGWFTVLCRAGWPPASRSSISASRRRERAVSPIWSSVRETSSPTGCVFSTSVSVLAISSRDRPARVRISARVGSSCFAAGTKLALPSPRLFSSSARAGFSTNRLAASSAH